VSLSINFSVAFSWDMGVWSAGIVRAVQYGTIITSDGLPIFKFWAPCFQRLYSGGLSFTNCSFADTLVHNFSHVWGGHFSWRYKSRKFWVQASPHIYVTDFWLASDCAWCKVVLCNQIIFYGATLKPKLVDWCQLLWCGDKEMQWKGIWCHKKLWLQGSRLVWWV